MFLIPIMDRLNRALLERISEQRMLRCAAALEYKMHRCAQ